MKTWKYWFYSFIYLFVWFNSSRFLPSIESHALRRASSDTFTVNSIPAGTTIGRKDKECGQIGQITIAGTFGWTIDAPAKIIFDKFKK